ncbi:MAG: M48 family peptidase [Acidobacteria bacterium]|nr:MAG: M48 family peptidase [Acidobacteriota bacterium]MCE7957139.1 M48 family peptidase [Acidobacteria bacterium ACB2]
MKRAVAPLPTRPPRAARTGPELKERALAWATVIGATPRRLQLQAMRSKWASCSTAGTVTLSRDLLREDAAFQEVVIVHELLHLLVPNHGPVFRSLMRAYVPTWEKVAAGRAVRSCGFQVAPREA